MKSSSGWPTNINDNNPSIYSIQRVCHRIHVHQPNDVELFHAGQPQVLSLGSFLAECLPGGFLRVVFADAVFTEHHKDTCALDAADGSGLGYLLSYFTGHWLQASLVGCAGWFCVGSYFRCVDCGYFILFYKQKEKLILFYSFQCRMMARNFQYLQRPKSPALNGNGILAYDSNNRLLQRTENHSSRSDVWTTWMENVPWL